MAVVRKGKEERGKGEGIRIREEAKVRSAKFEVRNAKSDH
jgi:hypothetical protein